MHSISHFIDRDRPDAAPLEVRHAAGQKGAVYAKAGAMLAYRGNVTFSRKASWKKVRRGKGSNCAHHGLESH